MTRCSLVLPTSVTRSAPVLSNPSASGVQFSFSFFGSKVLRNLPSRSNTLMLRSLPVGDPDLVALDHQMDRVAQLPTGDRAEREQEASLVREHTHPLVAEVHNVDTAVGTDRDADRPFQLVGALAGEGVEELRWGHGIDPGRRDAKRGETPVLSEVVRHVHQEGEQQQQHGQEHDTAPTLRAGQLARILRRLGRYVAAHRWSRRLGDRLRRLLRHLTRIHSTPASALQ